MGDNRVLVTGAGGFIGSHMVEYLKQKGCWVRGVDIVHPEFRETAADEFPLLDLRRWENCLAAAAGIEGCTRATIYWRLHEARKRLAHALREQMEP